MEMEFLAGLEACAENISVPVTIQNVMEVATISSEGVTKIDICEESGQST
jgi:hypothetical protein